MMTYLPLNHLGFVATRLSQSLMRIYTHDSQLKKHHKSTHTVHTKTHPYMA